MPSGHGPHEHNGVSCSCQSPPSSSSSAGSWSAQLYRTRIAGFINDVDTTYSAGVAVMYSDEALIALICLATHMPTKETCSEFLYSLEFALSVTAYLDLKERYQAAENVDIEQVDKLSSPGFLRKTLVLNLWRMHATMFSSEPMASSWYDYRYSNDLGVFGDESFKYIMGNKYLPEQYREKFRKSLLRRLFQQAWEDSEC